MIPISEKITLDGTVAKDCEEKTNASGCAYASFPVITNMRTKDGAQKSTFYIIAKGNLADYALGKKNPITAIKCGDRVLLSGTLQPALNKYVFTDAFSSIETSIAKGDTDAVMRQLKELREFVQDENINKRRPPVFMNVFCSGYDHWIEVVCRRSRTMLSDMLIKEGVRAHLGTLSDDAFNKYIVNAATKELHSTRQAGEEKTEHTRTKNGIAPDLPAFIDPSIGGDGNFVSADSMFGEQANEVPDNPTLFNAEQLFGNYEF